MYLIVYFIIADMMSKSINNIMEWLNKDIGNKFVIYKDSGSFGSMDDFINSDFYNSALTAITLSPQKTSVTPRKIGNYYVIHITADSWDDIQQMNHYMFKNHPDLITTLQKHQLWTPWDSHGGAKYAWIEKLATLELGYESELAKFNYDILLITHGDYPDRESVEASEWIRNIPWGDLEYNVILSGYHYALQIFGDKQAIEELIPQITGVEKIPDHIAGPAVHRYLKTLPPRQ